eukprot:64282_1
MGCRSSTNDDSSSVLEAYFSSTNIDFTNRDKEEMGKMYHVCRVWQKLFNVNALVNSLIYIIIKYAYTPYPKPAESYYCYKLTLIGDSRVGKTSIMIRFADAVFNESYIRTIGVDFRFRTIIIDDVTVKLQIWDVDGSDKNNVMSPFYKDAHGIYIVFDITNKISFEAIKTYYKEQIHKFGPETCVKFLIGSKCDLQKHREISTKEAVLLSNEIGCKEYIEVSAQKNINIESLFFKMVDQLLYHTQ